MFIIMNKLFFIEITLQKIIKILGTYSITISFHTSTIKVTNSNKQNILSFTMFSERFVVTKTLKNSNDTTNAQSTGSVDTETQNTQSHR